MMKPALLVIQENDAETNQLVNYMLDSDYFSSVDLTGDGQAALRIIGQKHIDYVITDLILPVMDGITFMRKCQLLSVPPDCYVLTSVTAGKILSEAFASGAKYCFIRPCHPSIILDKIMDSASRPLPPAPVTTAVTENSFRYQNRSIDERITSVFMSIGIHAHIKGYHFLRSGIILAVNDPSVINSITKRLYPAIAEEYDTSASKVERAIRHAIEVAWNSGKIANINSLFGIKVYSANEKPTNGEFIALLADKLLLEGDHVKKNRKKRKEVDDDKKKESEEENDV